MTHAMLTISLPIADRATSYAFYREALALEAIGAPAADGMPEPLQFDLSDGARLVLVPTGGFGGWSPVTRSRRGGRASAC